MNITNRFKLICLLTAFFIGSVATANTPPASAQIAYAGGDGSTIAKAVVIVGAKGEEDGVKSEYTWLEKHFPGYKTVIQADINSKGRMYDKLQFRTPDGTAHVVYFDISAYFGKY